MIMSVSLGTDTTLGAIEILFKRKRSWQNSAEEEGIMVNVTSNCPYRAKLTEK